MFQKIYKQERRAFEHLLSYPRLPHPIGSTFNYLLVADKNLFDYGALNLRVEAWRTAKTTT
jgi:hypothetical protein